MIFDMKDILVKRKRLKTLLNLSTTVHGCLIIREKINLKRNTHQLRNDKCKIKDTNDESG